MTASGAVSARSGRQRPNLAVLEGGRGHAQVLLVSAVEHEGLHLELVAARTERTVYAAKVHDLIRHVARHIATAHYAAAGTALLELDRLTTQERDRAMAMDAAACPDGCSGSGHGPATDDALDVPAERAA